MGRREQSGNQLLQALGPHARSARTSSRWLVVVYTWRAGQGSPAGTRAQGKTRITIRLDQNIVDRFFEMAEEPEDTLRRIIREELKSSAA